MPRSFSLIGVWMMLAAGIATAQSQADPGSSPGTSYDIQGSIDLGGRPTPYRIRNLPVSSFPELPAKIAAELSQRGCVIPQTYEAKRPENVIRGSFEGPGTADWAVLCLTGDQVSLLVFLESGSQTPATVASRPRASLLQTHDPTGILGFDWGIDPASPRRVHEAQVQMAHRPAPPDHDCIAEIEIDRRTIYHLYRNGAWDTVPTE